MFICAIISNTYRIADKNAHRTEGEALSGSPWVDVHCMGGGAEVVSLVRKLAMHQRVSPLLQGIITFSFKIVKFISEERESPL